MKNNLKSIREQLGMSQAEFGELIGVSQGNVSHCEQQRQEVSPEIARRVIAAARSKGLDVSFDDIYVAPPLAANDSGPLKTVLLKCRTWR